MCVLDEKNRIPVVFFQFLIFRYCPFVLLGCIVENLCCRWDNWVNHIDNI